MNRASEYANGQLDYLNQNEMRSLAKKLELCNGDEIIDEIEMALFDHFCAEYERLEWAGHIKER